jgi:actin-related protein
VATQTSKSQKEKMTQLLFEAMDVGGTYLADQAVLSLYGCGLVSGVVYSSGDGVTTVVPVYEGFIMEQAAVKQNIGGRDLTHLLQKRLQGKS